MKRDPRAGRRENDRPALVWPGKRARPAREGSALLPLHLAELCAGADGTKPPMNRLIHADNRDALPALIAELAGQVDLVYLDPPFGTGGDFLARTPGEDVHAYSDRWAEGLGEYLSTLLEQLELLRALLSDRGTIFLHCDWRVSHHLRCLLDEVFGPACFKNEIVWRYRRWPAKTRIFQRMHDVLFWYGKTPGDHHAWTPLYEDLAPSTLQTWGTKRQIADFSSGRRKPSQTDEETLGAPMADVWDIGIIAPIAHERVGYPTQKPEALLRRVIEAASKPGDLVADLFAGSGTTLAVAEKLGRRWIGCDKGAVAIHTAKKRLLSLKVPAGVEALDRGCSPFALYTSAAPAQEEGSLAGVSIALERAGAKRARVRLSGEAAVDYWAIDWDHDGRVFKAGWFAARGKKRGSLPIEAEHAWARPGPRRVAVQLLDAAGSESRRVLAVE
jgi:DNA modification methylase